MMTNLKPLIFMQLQDKIDFSFLKTKKQTIFKIVLSLLKFIVITGLVYAAFYVVSLLRLTDLNSGIPHHFFTVIITIMLSLSIIVCSFGLVKSLYHAKDNALLFTFPAQRTTVFASKLIVYYIYEFMKNIYFMLPVLLAYGLINGLAFYYFIWLLPTLFLLTAIPVCIGAMLSIPLLFALNTIKQYKWLEYSLTIVLIAGVVYLLISLINAIPENLNIIGNWGSIYWDVQDVLNLFINVFNPFYQIVLAIVGIRYAGSNIMFTGEQFIGLGIIFALIAVSLIVTWLLVRPLFFKMASSPFEYKKVKITKVYKNKQHNSFWSSVNKELLLTYRTPEKFYGLLAVVIGLPIAILLLNKIYASIDTRLTGLYMSFAFNILLILLIALSSNINMARVYSEEGASSYLNKTNPKPYIQTLLSKIFINAIFVSLSLLATTFIFTSFVGYDMWTSLVIFILFESVYLAHLFWSAENDIMNPQNMQYQTTGSHINNPNEIKSSITMFLLAALFAFLTYFLLGDSGNSIWIKMCVVAIAFCALRIWLYVNKIKVYYKEKQ